MGQRTIKDLSDAELLRMESLAVQKKLSSFSDKELLELEQKAVDAIPISAPEAAVTLGRKGLLLGTTGFLAGVGEGVGGAIEAAQQGKGFGEVIEEGKRSFQEGRARQVELERQSREKFPVLGTAAEIAGTVPTFALTPLKALTGFKGAVAAGGLVGAGKGLSEAESAGELAAEVGKGVAIGGVTGGIFKGLGAVAKGPVGRAISGSAQKAFEKTKDTFRNAFTKTAKALTGVPRKDIDVFIVKHGKVVDLIETFKAADDAGEDVILSVKDDIFNALSSKKSALNKELSTAIDGAEKALGANKRIIEIAPLVDKARSFAARIDPDIETSALKQVEKDIIAPMIAAAKGTGKISPSQLQKLKMSYQDLSLPAFKQTAKGIIFSEPKHRVTVSLANSMRASAKEMMDDVLPQSKIINSKLAELHNIQDRIKPLLRETAPAVKFTALARQANKNTKVIKEVDELLGSDFLGQFQELASARSFTSPPIFTVDTTGKGVERFLKAGAAGALVFGSTEIKILGAIAATATSPLALKTVIKAGALSKGALSALAKVSGLSKITPENAAVAFEAMQKVLAGEAVKQADQQRDNPIKRAIRRR